MIKQIFENVSETNFLIFTILAGYTTSVLLSMFKTVYKKLNFYETEKKRGHLIRRPFPRSLFQSIKWGKWYRSSEGSNPHLTQINVKIVQKSENSTERCLYDGILIGKIQEGKITDIPIVVKRKEDLLYNSNGSENQQADLLIEEMLKTGKLLSVVNTEAKRTIKRKKRRMKICGTIYEASNVSIQKEPDNEIVTVTLKKEFDNKTVKGKITKTSYS